MFSPIHCIVTAGNCGLMLAYSARFMLFALTTTLRHGVHLAIVYFITNTHYGTKMCGEWNQTAQQMTIIIEWDK